MNTPTHSNVQMQRIRAIGLAVTNCDRSLNFYREALSFELIGDITVEGQDYSDLEGVTVIYLSLVLNMNFQVFGINLIIIE